MSNQPFQGRLARWALLPGATTLFAALIFVADTITPADIAFANFYAVVVLMAARFLSARGVGLVAAACVILTILSYYLTPFFEHLQVPGGQGLEGVANMIISLGVIGLTAFGVAQYKSAEESLREKASLLDLTHDTVFSRTINDVITYWNKAAEQLYGWMSGEAVGKVSHELLQPSFGEPPDQVKAELLRAGRWEGEAVYKKRDGSTVVVNSRWALQQERDGRPALILETNNDISERKRGDEALRQAQEELARLNRISLMGEISASIAHEVNQPIAAIVTNAGAGLRWLNASPANVEEARGTLDRILRDGGRAGQIIERIRGLATRVTPRRDRLDVNAVIGEVLALNDAQLRQNQIQLQIRASASPPLVFGDRVQLMQVLMNLVINALDAMRVVNDRPRELTIVTELASDKVSAEVRDNGVGLDAKVVEKLFQSFYTTKPEGIGMGLAISRSIVEAHGGRLEAAPNQPYGAIFLMSLPPAESS